MTTPSITLFSGQVTDTNSPSASPHIPRGGPVDVMFLVWGSLNGGTVTLEQTPDEGTTWIELANVTAGSHTELTLYEGGAVRATLTGGGGAASVNAVLWGVGAEPVATRN